mgnify:CR=1 FL=1
MRIIVDAFGGDNAPLSVLEGARDAKKEYSVDIVLAGDETKIRKCAEETSISSERIRESACSNFPCMVLSEFCNRCQPRYRVPS